MSPDGVGAHGAGLVPPPSLFVIGAGRAGLGVALAAHAAGGRVLGVHGRRTFEAGPLGTVTHGAIPNAAREADVVLVAVRDRELDAALGEVLPLRPRVVLHASGSAEPFEVMTLRREGIACGTFHPLVPLADPARAPGLLRGAWVGVDGDAPAVEAAEALAALVGARALGIPSGGKGRYHAAAVLASNFPTVLAALAERLMSDAGVDPEAARESVRHLLASAAANVAAGDAAAALTGPVARGDAPTVAMHRRALAGRPKVLAAYDALSRAALDIARGADAGVDEDALRAVAAELR